MTWVNIPAISTKWCVLEIDLEFPKELRELQINFHLASDVIKIKIKVMSEYQLEIYTVLIYTIFLLLILKLYLRLELKLKKYLAY